MKPLFLLAFATLLASVTIAQKLFTYPIAVQTYTFRNHFPNGIEKTLDEYKAMLKELFPELELNSLILTDRGEEIYPKFVYNKVRQYLSTVTTAKKRSPHVLRHSFATHLSNNGAELNAIKDLLGHSSLASTQVYTHTSIENLKKVYEKAHPKGKKS